MVGLGIVLVDGNPDDGAVLQDVRELRAEHLRHLLLLRPCELPLEQAAITELARVGGGQLFPRLPRALLGGEEDLRERQAGRTHVPLALGLSEGAIIAAELATVVIGGLFTSTFLTLLIVPVMYHLLNRLGREQTAVQEQ